MKLEVQNTYGFDNRLNIHTYNQQKKSNMLFWGAQGIVAGTSGILGVLNFIPRDFEELKKAGTSGNRVLVLSLNITHV